MASAASNVPAVVVGGTLNGLGVIRSLALGGVPIHLLETTRQCVAAWSRHSRFWRTSSLEGNSLVEALINMADSLQCRPVLFLTSDQTVATVSAQRERLQQFYHLSLPSPEIVSALANKSSFHLFAQREGIPIPRGLPISSEIDLPKLSQLLPPIIIKPADKRLVLNGTVERAVRADTLADAQAAAAHMLRQAPQLIAQEWIDGPDSDIYFTLFSCDRNSRPLGIFAGRKLVCSPPAIGSTALCVAAPDVAETLYPYTYDFISRTGYRGLGGLEFKRDSRTGQFLAIEPTVGRSDWQEEIATLCGVNLPLLTYFAATGQPRELIPSNDARAIAWRMSTEIQIPTQLNDSDARIIDGMLRWIDPLPAVYYYGYERLALRLWRGVLQRNGLFAKRAED